MQSMCRGDGTVSRGRTRGPGEIPDHTPMAAMFGCLWANGAANECDKDVTLNWRHGCQINNKNKPLLCGHDGPQLCSELGHHELI